MKAGAICQCCQGCEAPNEKAIIAIQGHEGETSVVLLKEAMIEESLRSRTAMLSNQEIRNICSHLDRSAGI